MASLRCARINDFDFDLTVQRLAFSSTPGDSLRSYFSSQAAAMKGSQNLAGISDPVIDALIDTIIAADSRTSLTTACMVLDRVIRTGCYWVPHWYKALALARLLGRVRPTHDQTALRARHPRDLVVRSRQGDEDRSVSRTRQ